MTHTLEMALFKAKYAVKQLNNSNVVKDQAKRITVLKNPQHNDYFVYENSMLMGAHSVDYIGHKYGTTGWEAGR